MVMMMAGAFVVSELQVLLEVAKLLLMYLCWCVLMTFWLCFSTGKSSVLKLGSI